MVSLLGVVADGVNVAFQVVPSYFFFSSFDLKLDIASSHCSTLWYKLVLLENIRGKYTWTHLDFLQVTGVNHRHQN